MPSPKHHTLGLCGFAGAGKDTVADLLVAHAGFRKLAFADTLRAEIEDAFHVEPLVLTRRDLKELPMAELALRKGPREFAAIVLMEMGHGDHFGGIDAELSAPRSPRQIMQWWGTQYRRAQNPSYWTRSLAQRVTYLRKVGETRFVVTDCRFENEAATLRCLGARLWQIKRPQLNVNNTPDGTHVSANDGSAFDPDVVINNDYDIKHLQQLVLGEFWAADAGLQSVKVTIE